MIYTGRAEPKRHWCRETKRRRAAENKSGNARKTGLTRRSTGRLEKKKARHDAAVMTAFALTTAAAFTQSQQQQSFGLKSKQQEDAKSIEGEEHKGRWSVSLRVSYLILRRGAAFHIQQRCLAMQWVWCKRALQALHCEAHFECALLPSIGS